MNILLGIIGLVGVAIGSYLIGQSSVKNDGLFIIDDSGEETTKWIIDIRVDPLTLSNKKIVRFKVKKITKDGDV